MKGVFEYEYLTFKKSHLRNLIALARVDGHLHQSELELIYKIGKRYELKEKHISGLLEDMESYEPVVPEARSEQLDQLRDLVLLMLADGRIDDHEMTFCKEIATVFGISENIITELVEIVEAEPVSGSTWKENREKLLETL